MKGTWAAGGDRATAAQWRWHESAGAPRGCKSKPSRRKLLACPVPDSLRSCISLRGKWDYEGDSGEGGRGLSVGDEKQSAQGC